MEVQSLAALDVKSGFITPVLYVYCLIFSSNLGMFVSGSHENIVGSYSPRFENEHLCSQMELCDYSLSSQKSVRLTEWDALTAPYQVNHKFM